ncbi:MAG: phosphoribosylformylglycinamidine synthase I [Dehalococcoidia bacterium]|nr:phosphoribosylformylglycinamidine synthase I [Dehalococcoidia bacterium]
MATVKTIVMRAPGTNRDEETAFAFRQVGATAETVHVGELISGTKRLADYQVLAFPGGFSYGDDLGAGRVQANELILKLADEVHPFIERGGLIIGACNGFQVLVKAGILPGPLGTGQTATLTNNDSGRFECRWVYLAANKKSRCIFTQGLELICAPVAHGEGKFVAPPEVMDAVDVALYYADAAGNPSTSYPACPSGSLRAIAGITDATGHIFGLMPHPEDNIHRQHHPHWTRREAELAGSGLKIFRNAVDWVKGS